MKADNPLTRKFLSRYPMEAARVLEQVSTEHVAALWTELPAQMVAPVMAAMLPKRAAACLEAMAAMPAAKLAAELPAPSAARIYRLLSTSKQNELSERLTSKIRDDIRRHLEYPAESAGSLLDPAVDMLPENMTVAEAIRRIERFDRSVRCDIYIVDEAQHLVGMIELGRLLASNHHIRLRDIMVRKTQPLSVRASTDSLLSHPGWMKRYRLPVVERDGTLVGVLDYNDLRNSMGERKGVGGRDPLENLLSLASLYWLSMAQLLDSTFTIARPDKDHEC